MMKTQKKTANIIGGKTARACESCLKGRASWFCAADDAFLCHVCDSSVHSANELAGRHTRVSLKTSKPPQPPPNWHRGFTKKPRTPRRKHSHYTTQIMPVVPQVGNDDDDDEYEHHHMVEDEDKKSTINDHDQMVFSVPNLDDDDHHHPFEHDELFDISLIGFEGGSIEGDYHGGHEWEFPAKEMAEFAADVESLHEQENDNDLHENKGFKGVLKHEQEGETISSSTTNDHCFFDWSIDVESEMLNFDLNTNIYNNNYGDYCGKNNDEHIHLPLRGEQEEEHNNNKNNYYYYYYNNNNNYYYYNNNMVLKDEVEESNNNNVDDDGMQANKRGKVLLRLNYEEVMNAWVSRGCSSPWTTGRRPEFDLDHHGWPYRMGDLWTTGGDGRGNVKSGDGGREARVSKYKEKRRTRLFSKKIRYEVRKLNAERRPRLKGRFVKSTPLSFHK